MHVPQYHELVGKYGPMYVAPVTEWPSVRFGRIPLTTRFAAAVGTTITQPADISHHTLQWPSAVVRFRGVRHRGPRVVRGPRARR
jgi:hypothetical protein